MHYFALLLGPEATSAPDPEAQAAEMTAYQDFHAKAASAIRAGDALQPSATGVRITGGPDAPIVTDGPFAEGAEVAGGYYVFEADNLDEALALARDIPAAKYGAVEVWPMVHFSPARAPLTGDSWLALLLEPPGSVGLRPAARSGTRESGARRVRQGRGRSHRRRRAAAPADDGDHGAGARRRGAVDRRAVRRRRRGRQRVLLLTPPTATRRSSWRR